MEQQWGCLAKFSRQEFPVMSAVFGQGLTGFNSPCSLYVVFTMALTVRIAFF